MPSGLGSTGVNQRGKNDDIFCRAGMFTRQVVDDFRQPLLLVLL